jgi:hypothetical protein
MRETSSQADAEKRSRLGGFFGPTLNANRFRHEGTLGILTLLVVLFMHEGAVILSNVQPDWKGWEESIFLPFAKVGMRIDRQHLHLYQHDITWNIQKVPFSTPDFFIGWALPQRLGAPSLLPEIGREGVVPVRTEQVQNRRSPNPAKEKPLPPD